MFVDFLLEELNMPLWETASRTGAPCAMISLRHSKLYGENWNFLLFSHCIIREILLWISV